MTIEPRNLTAQIQHRAAGNPPSTLPDAAISNCFPGLEFDARNLWRRVLRGITLHEASGLVTAAEPEFARLVGRYLVQVGDAPVYVTVHGPSDGANGAPVGDDVELGGAFLEWSNALADAVAAGGTQACQFVAVGPNAPPPETVELDVRPLFATGDGGEPLPVLAEDLLEPGDLTQSLCSPWQNDYRECGCYYWAASRPDYVNVEPAADGTTVGTSWMARDRSPTGYTPDFGGNPAQFSYEDLFRDWQGLLRFVVDGRDHD